MKMSSFLALAALPVVAAQVVQDTQQSRRSSSSSSSKAMSATLDDAFTLGYIEAPFVDLGTRLDARQGTSTNHSLARLRVGRTGIWALTLPWQYDSWKYDDSTGYTYSFPGLRLAMRPTEEVILDFQLGSSNMWYTKDKHARVNGFSDAEAAVTLDGFMHYLGQGGKIGLNERKAPAAYRYGPLLDERQLELVGRWNVNARDTLLLKAYEMKIGYGFSPYLQGWIHLEDTALDTAVIHDSRQNFSVGFDWVQSQWRLGALGIHHDTTIRPTISFTHFGVPENWIFAGYAGFMGGSTPTAGQVAGNWSGFYDPRLNVGEWDVEDSIYGQPRENAETQWSLHGSARYGALDDVTLGLAYDVDFIGGVKSSFYFTSCFSNMKPSSDGPSSVSALNYEFGALPQEGESRLLLSFRLPGADLRQEATAAQIEGDFLSAYASPWESDHRGWNHPSEARMPFRAELLYGLRNFLFVMGTASHTDSYVEHVGTSTYPLDNLWGFSLGAGIHTSGFLLRAGMSYYESSVAGDSTNTLPGHISRFGPVGIQAVVNF